MTHKQAAATLLITMLIGLSVFFLGLYLTMYIHLLAGILLWVVVLAGLQTYALDFLEVVKRMVK